MQRCHSLIFLCIALCGIMLSPRLAAAQGMPDFPDLQSAQFVTTASGLKVWVLEKGDSPTVTTGTTVWARYAGWLENGTVFDANTDGKAAFKFKAGKGEVIPGWDEAVMMLGPGGKAYLIVPPKLGYGENGVEDLIPPHSNLVFYMEVTKVK